MGPRLGRVEYRTVRTVLQFNLFASMGPRLGRVEYVRFTEATCDPIQRFNGATLRTRGILVSLALRSASSALLQWGHA